MGKMPVIKTSNTFVLDNGAYYLKAGFSNQSSPRLMPNCIMKAKSEKRRAFVGDQVDDCRDLSSLFYILPFQKGYLINWDHQKTVWDYLFGSSCFNIDASNMNMIFTEPYFNFNSIQEGLSEMLFEEYRFKNVLRTHAGDLACYKNKVEMPDEKCCLIIETGFSFTHVVPYVMGKRVREAVTRIDVGGKLLTNCLKEMISYRQIHVLDETYVMNSCKEDCCYVSLDFEGDMARARIRGRENPIARDYVLPDFTSIRRGFMKSQEQSTGRPNETEQIIRMNNERFSIPEMLFNPSDIGIHQMGIPEAVIHSVNQCPEETRPWLYRNIVLTGGNALFPNIRERMEREIRELAPSNCEVNVLLPEDPITYSWQGGAALASDSCLKEISLSREEYLERGFQACQEKYYL